MTTTFGGSRLANLREKRTSGDEGSIKSDAMKLSMPGECEPVSYEPSSSNNLSRTQTRLLKGRIERTEQVESKAKVRQTSHSGCRGGRVRGSDWCSMMTHRHLPGRRRDGILARRAI